MELIRKQTTSGSVLFNKTMPIDTLYYKGFSLNYSCIRAGGYSLLLSLKGDQCIIEFGCQKLNLKILKEIQDNLNEVFIQKEQNYVIISPTKKLVIKSETDGYFMVKDGRVYDKKIYQSAVIKTSSKKITMGHNYWEETVFKYNGHELGSTKKYLLARVNYCIELIEGFEQLKLENK